MRLTKAIFQLFSITILLVACGKEASAGQQPVLTPYPQPPAAISLSNDEKAMLERGEPVYKKVGEGDEGRASAVFRVKASRETIWKTIQRFDKYTDWVPNVTGASVYSRNGDTNYLVEFKLGVMFMTYTYYIRHNYPQPSSGRSWGTWTLDYEKDSDITDSVGFWNVEPVPGQAKLCTVSYSVAIRAGGLAEMLRPIMEENGVQDATTWLKKRAEEARN